MTSFEGIVSAIT